MKQINRRSNIPVLMLHNIDPAWEPAEKTAAIDAVEELNTELRNEGHPVIDVPVFHDALHQILKPYSPKDYIVFNWCEELPGKLRSDKIVAETLEKLNFIYTGSSPEVLELSWNKPATKALLDKHGIPTPFWKVIDTKEADSWDRFPSIVKPAYEHCSVGITADAVVMNRQALKKRISFVKKNFDQPVIVEDFIDGREFHVTLWGNGTVNALPPAEMDFAAFENIKDRLCTFDSKFTPGSQHYEKIELRIPASLDEKQTAYLNQTAMNAYRIMGCRDYARIDLRLQNKRYYVLDVNPNADFSPDTSLVYAAQAVGLSYGAMASWIVNLAAQRHSVFKKLYD
ncbi:MAG: ATP-grasp domain-containing protein [Desulfobacterium sp.]|nr:ATP-grasp domain-containing protein [Desulfobacterium sp.]MBU3950134.1 ATP-grasp domain-containing protein [Pseudomonadota bacterium]MBU4009596.1 ATP-grasp domain-containing protein [Pseudomonadota bacterium]MBU4053225.1 ATP-grasp domain-containing protein [Pseudomonadota bacterium]